MRLDYVEDVINFNWYFNCSIYLCFNKVFISKSDKLKDISNPVRDTNYSSIKYKISRNIRFLLSILSYSNLNQIQIIHNILNIISR